MIQTTPETTHDTTPDLTPFFAHLPEPGRSRTDWWAVAGLGLCLMSGAALLYLIHWVIRMVTR